ncbi:type II secretion system protein [uncultured Desulfuromonas sp.]|uniref:type II secretion system protein n=1 Tax=uncultured Desulfuromonas sp. TaxID=181013 RepID=UPI002AAC1F86|nr:type II secretion system protein [uncultured Desulfuromonas sp.]
MSSIAMKLHTLLQKQRKMRQRRKIGESGFTLLEILVVLTIMGFLIAMVAPRLAGISSSAVDTVCDSNQNRTIQMAAAYFERTGNFPSKLTNLVSVDGTDWDAATYAIPTISDGDPDNGQETLAEEFGNRVAPTIHYLNASEAQELADMGIKKVFNLNAYDNMTVTAEGNPMEEVIPTSVDYTTGTFAVMMSGMGVDSNGSWVTDTLTGFGEADFLGRIVLGFGPENGLVTSGLVSNAAHCPGGIQNADNITYNDYNLIVPRLQSTVDRLDETTPEITDMASEITGIQYVAYGYTEDDEADLQDATSGGITAATFSGNKGTIDVAPAGIKTRVLTFGAQEKFQYATMCPEGHMYPADDSDFWAIDPANANIDAGDF